MNKNYYIISLFLLFSASFVFANNDWHKYWIGDNWYFTPHDSIIQSSTANPSGGKGMQSSEEIIFMDSLNGFLFCSHYGDGPWIFRTTNGGHFWKEIFVDDGKLGGDTVVYWPGYYGKSVVIDDLIISTAWYNNIDGENKTGYIFRSSDGGKSFEKIEPDAHLGFTDISMYNANYGAMLASGHVLITNDSGKTWDRSEEQPDSMRSQSNIQVVGYGKIFRTFVWVQKPGLGLHRIFYSSDHGNTWVQRKSDDYHISKVHFFDENEGLLVGYDSLNPEYQNRLYVNFTDNGGISWRRLWDTIMFVDRWSIRDLEVYDRYNAVMGGDWGDLFQTTDGGNNWNYIGTMGERPKGQLGFPFKTISFAGKNKLVASGILWASDEILHIPLETPVNSVSEKPDIQFKIYPNPATDYINIELQNMFGKQISILNTLGLNVWNGVVTEESQEIDVSNLTPGMYLIRINEHYQFFIKR